MGLAEAYDVDRTPTSLEALQLDIADRLVFSKWRDGLGGVIRTVIVGGAALCPELVNRFGAAGLHVVRGYGTHRDQPGHRVQSPGAQPCWNSQTRDRGNRGADRG